MHLLFPLGFGRPIGFRIRATFGLLALLAATVAIGVAAPVQAATATLVVNGQTGTDSGNCVSTPCSTLQYALNQAETGDTIEVEGDVSASDSPTTGGAVIPTSISRLSIVGAGGYPVPRLLGGLGSTTFGSTLTVQPGQTVVISNLEVADGLAQFGGGIYNGGNLTLEGSLVDINAASPSTILCNNSTGFCQGVAEGGGIYNDGSLTVYRSAVLSNVARDFKYTSSPPGGLQLLLQGGGIYNAGSLVVSESSLANNEAAVTPAPVEQTAAGGAIFNIASYSEVIASTIYQNSAPVGPGIYQGAGIGAPYLGLGASLIAGNIGSGGLADECAQSPGASPPTSLGYNAGDSGAGASCGLNQPTDEVASNVNLYRYQQSNGYGLAPGQPSDYQIPFGTALGGVLVCPALDQFGQARPLPPEASCTAGAVEPQSGALQPVTPAAPAITSGATATFTVGVQGSFQVSASGSPGPAVFESGALPAGVTVSPRGLISGTPSMTAAGTYPITLSAENTVDPAATQQFTLVVDRHPTGLTLRATPNPADAGHQLSFTATVTGGVQGVEPTGQVTVSTQQQTICTIALSSGSGSCSATLATAPPTGLVTVSATYSGDQSYQPTSSSVVVQYVGSPEVSVAASLPAATYGTPYQVALVATGGTTPYLWSLGSGAPPGLAVSGAQLAGTPTAAGTFQFSVTATDAQGVVATQEESLTVLRQTPSESLVVSPSGSVAGRPVTLTSKVLGTGGASEPTGTVTFSAQGASLCSASLSGGVASCSTTQLPLGGGSVTATYPGSSDYAAATAQAAYLVVAPLRITTSSLPSGELGQAYNFHLAASGGTPPIVWTISGGSLPQGLSLSPSGLISGVPIRVGEQPVTLSVSDASAQVPQQATIQFQVTVLSAPSAPGSSLAGSAGASSPSVGAAGGGDSSSSSGAVGSSGVVSAGRATTAFSWRDAVGVVTLAVLVALGVFLGRRRRAR
jgi:hypothetical protein